MEKLSEVEEKRIFNALERAISAVNGGEHPNDAIYKVASEEKFMPQFVQRMSEAYNVSKTLAHLKTASALTKANDFPLADSTAILGRMYPERVLSPVEKTAMVFKPAEYTVRETTNFNKAARFTAIIPRMTVSEYEKDDADLERRAWDKRAGLKKRAEVLKGDARAKFFELMKLAGEAGEHFHFVTHTPFREVETQITRAYGDLGKSAMAMVHHYGAVNEKQASLAEIQESQSVWYESNKEPYTKIAKLIEASREFHKLAHSYAVAADSLEQFEEKSGALIPSTSKPIETSLLGGSLGKAAAAPSGATSSFLGNAPSQAANVGLSMLGLNPNKSEDSVRRGATADVYDPMHESKLNSYKMRAVLNDLLVNDEDLSTKHPHDVLTAYNHLSELAPGVAQQPAIVRGMIRRMLNQDGMMEPFEAQQAVGIEKSLKDMVPQPQAMPAK